MAPQLGEIRIADLEEQLRDKGITAKVHDPVEGEPAPPAHAAAQQQKSIFDQNVLWWTRIPLAIWDKPKEAAGISLGVSTRMSSLVALILSRKGEVQDITQTITFAFYSLIILFVTVELTALIIGISITRTMTNAVHNLYEGTLRVQLGDFSHRILVHGKDQVAALSDSFNSMTTKIQQLLVVAKEKERLQTEVEIAREVQAQLFPREIPGLASIELTAVCNAARTVSGDYYDFRQLGANQVAIVMGDVSGKGISAALLMATLASSLRTQLGHWLESDCGALSTSDLVSKLNKHLYAHTSPEKYATFCLGIYDNKCGTLTYTNAGHLPPILIRNGDASMLDVNGMVVGAFPFAKYAESTVELEENDILLFYTDGITEPENEYGEMFGEERLMELLIRHAGCTNAEIIRHIIDAVQLWTYDKDSMDDMTLLVARRK
jgi:sigma-B regulation protein RsbU (phosphoserine phosphatase)